MENVDDILMHYGVKGMRWGVRRAERAAARAATTEAEIVSTKGRKIKTKGGRNLPVVKEALDTALTSQKAKASGVKALTNKELRDAVQRMQLEQQFAQISAQRNTGLMAKGQKFVKELLGVGNMANQVVQFTDSPAAQELRKQLKAAG